MNASKDRADFYALVAEIVFVIQDTENAIRICEKVVFGTQFEPTEIYKNDKRSLGRLVKDLKTKVMLAEDFKDTLEAFVTNRNILIHRAIDQPWWEAIRQKNFEPAFGFLWDLVKQTETVKLVFESAILEYARNMTDGNIDKILGDFRDIGYLDAIEHFSEFARRSIKRREGRRRV